MTKRCEDCRWCVKAEKQVLTCANIEARRKGVDNKAGIWLACSDYKRKWWKFWAKKGGNK